MHIYVYYIIYNTIFTLRDVIDVEIDIIARRSLYGIIKLAIFDGKVFLMGDRTGVLYI